MPFVSIASAIRRLAILWVRESDSQPTQRQPVSTDATRA